MLHSLSLNFQREQPSPILHEEFLWGLSAYGKVTATKQPWSRQADSLKESQKWTIHEYKGRGLEYVEIMMTYEGTFF